MISGATFIIECTQLLESDQTLKILQTSKTISAKVCKYQLDMHKTNPEHTELSDNIWTILSRKKTASIEQSIVSFMLFTSPEELLNLT